MGEERAVGKGEGKKKKRGGEVAAFLTLALDQKSCSTCRTGSCVIDVHLQLRSCSSEYPESPCPATGSALSSAGAEK